MVEIPFVRRRSAKKSLSEDDLISPVETTETTSTRSNTIIRRLTKPRQINDPHPLSQRTDSRGPRSNLADSNRKSFERRSFRSSLFFTESASPEVESWIVEEPLELDYQGDSENGTMSAEMFKSVAKKTSLKNILCDKEEPSESLDAGIDLDAAIQLLQELKKKASPEELVALHRALLPTKGGQTKDHAEEITTSPYSRRSSMVVPGIATRSKSPAKSPKVAHSPLVPSTTTPVKKRRPLSQQIESMMSRKEPALARQTSCIELPPHKGIPTLSRSYSPADLDVSTIGALRLGTLRVTNGSPEPSIASEAEESGPFTSSGHSRSRSEPKQTLEWTAEEANSLRDEATTPRPGTSMRVEDARRSVIPGLDAYHDSSEEEEAAKDVKQQTPRLQPDYQESLAASGPYKKPAFNVSVGSIISRLSTIQDDESMAERAPSPSGTITSNACALQRLTGQATNQSPPPSSGSDSSSMYPGAIHRLSPLHSNPRPAVPVKSDSGYASETHRAGRFSLSDEESPDSFPTPKRPTSWGLAMRSHCQLETIPSVSDILSTVDGDSDCKESYDGTFSDPQTTPKATSSPFVSPTTSSVPPPIQRNPASSSSSIPSFVSSEPELLDTKASEKALKPRKKLYKPPPAHRNTSSEVLPTPMSPNLYPSVPDELSVNFSRRISRTPGTFHPEHALAAQAHVSKESLVHGRVSTDLASSPTPCEDKARTPVRATVDIKGTPDSTPEVGLEKKKSRFRLRGRSRSKSLARPEVHLPREQGTPTVSETVPQFADIVRAKEVELQGDKARQRSVSRPRAVGDNSTRESNPGYPAIERVADQRWSPRAQPDPENSVEYKPYRRADSVPREQEQRRQSAVVERPAREENVPRRARSKSMAANVGRVARNDHDSEQTATPRTPKNKSSAYFQSTPQQVQSEPKVQETRRERRNTFAQVFLRGTSRDRLPRSPRSRSRSNSRSPKLPDVNNPAYIASRFSSPPPDKRSAMLQSPHHVPSWESDRDGGKPNSAQATPTPTQGKFDNVTRNDSAVSASSVHASARKSATPRSAPLANISTNVVQSTLDRDDDANYRAYRASDAISITKLTSPLRETRDPIKKQPRQPPPPPPNGLVHATHAQYYAQTQAQANQARRTPRHLDGARSPDSLFDRYGGGLDYGWERGNGFQGSAGTRSQASDKAHRKSLVLSESHGVDLSDIPVFVKKV
ncbi:hypothetical protein CAC42_3128 [Sphaceloma murrayae]|uniref:Uncharacterized protein n=1 Tax=Sphaceloma murrayae TaxID=2082308 RepID=A0A2K1QS94_9PEZI|nr:hypothetical protein CAC42_3128 [Sphaceloma murrayae]